MSGELVVQSQAAFQKQPHIFLNAKGVRKAGAKPKRWFKEVGLGFKTPREAINGDYIDKKCPFVGDISIRGRILTGTVVSTKMARTIGNLVCLIFTDAQVVRREYLQFVPKYRRYEKRHKNFSAHASPCFRINDGDIVTVGQCRPLSKTVRFNVLRVDRHSEGVKAFTRF